MYILLGESISFATIEVGTAVKAKHRNILITKKFRKCVVNFDYSYCVFFSYRFYFIKEKGKISDFFLLLEIGV